MSITITNRQGKKLSVATYGQPSHPAIVFSNSLGTDKNMWAEQIAALKDQYFIISYDTRGHGESDVISATTLKNLGEDVLDILDTLQVEHAHFCGISMGGITGLWLGIYTPLRFYSITVANSAAKIGTTAAWNSRADSVEQNGLQDIAKSTHTRWFSEQFDYENSVLAQRTIQSLRDTSLQGYANACRALANADVSEQLSQMNLPVLIIAGAMDPVTTITDATFMQQRIVDSQLVLINASHLSNIEQSEKFTQVLKGFIESI
ncbi:alpha/beta fold hydrolase [Acinetobacter qingfengensis]|uniref:3-oxoadipate enol-lactonase n=1 Tax=Acinetobacter qingfengensis TaxID=1262585 RepID=A0A1E7RDD3_9GAMM|nr:alpha/beta fold hydrolase [Acinetobacter qingfengensis]KAA8734461.1 alpha/beta fold hydrolase [Acinetobacter qingfengensis]OEY97374.1 3-oxoadipate enol-lactonase [Acinetobacter qingfengensis]